LDAFVALDSGPAASHGVLLRAGAHQVAVGVADPALGWVEVRAERVGGQITAALTADSAASHAALTSAMPSMATYLQDHQTGVQHIHVETGLAGGQAGAGSQGQSSSQGDARDGAAESTALPATGSTGWTSAATGAEQTSHTTAARSAREGHQVSIRA
jgi:flagellar hook-length control protein FliK